MTARVLILTSALVLSAGLAGCGKVGPLERPGPMFGSPQAAANGDDPQDKQDPSRPVDTVDPRDRSTDPVPPSRTLPIPGTNTGASTVAPQTALPDPYANPRR